jgi:3D (Asp-Asp-Asp) domain-containing protein
MLLGPMAAVASVAGAPSAVENRVAHTERREGARRLYVLVTAYCLHGRTATGNYVHAGTTAVDPNVIKLGSRLWIPHYGYGKAEDTGSAIRGLHVDEWRARCDVARRMTRHETITVWR